MASSGSARRPHLLTALARCALALGLWLCPELLLAQTMPGGSLAGVVTDQQGAALEGAVVRAGASDMRAHSTVTDARGDYRFAELPPAEYTLTVERDGFATAVRGGFVVREGVNVEIDFALSLGTRSEIVSVAGDASLLERKTAAQAVNLSGRLLRELPLSSLRTWDAFLLATPGVAVSQARFSAYTLHGAGSSSGVFLVDGADATSVLQGSTLYSQFAEDAFEDVHVKTAAVDAASPLGLGAVVNIATQSGTNRFHGSATLSYQPKAWNGDNTPNGQSLTIDVMQPEGSLGGPLKRDHWWFFGSFRVARDHTGISRSAQQVAYLKALSPGFTPFDNIWQGQFGFAKITGQLTSQHQLLISATRDRLSLGGAQPTEAAQFRKVVVGGPNYYARLSSTWRSSLLTRWSLGYNDKGQQNVNLQPGITGVNVYQSTFQSGGRLIGSGLLGSIDASPFSGTDFPTHMWTMTADASWEIHGPIGSHELQTGVYLQPGRHDEWIANYNNAGAQLEDVVLRDPSDPARGVVPFHRQVYAVGALTTMNVDSRDNAVYAQDAWRALPRMTINAGLRVDFVRRIDRLFDVVTQQSTEIGPRFGVNYSLTADAKSSLQFSFSRVHDNLSVNETTAGTNITGVRDFYDTTGDGTFSTVFVTPPRTGVSSNLQIDLQHYHQPRVDEFAAGYRRQLARSTQVSVTATRRAYRNRPAAVDINGVYQDGVFAGYRDVSQNEIYELTANTWNWPVATAVSAVAAAETGRLHAVLGYSREWSHLEGTWQPNDPASFLQPDAFPNRNGIGFVSGCTAGPCADVNSVAGSSGSGFWHSHILNLDVSYQGPWGLLLASSYNFQSGPWSGPIYTEVAPDPRFGPSTVTLSNGRIVSNPLATPIRIAYPTRADGQFTLGGLQVWSARLGRAFPIASRRLQVALDVHNLTNHGADQAFQVGGNQLTSPFFGQGGSRQFPRSAQLNARFSF